MVFENTTNDGGFILGFIIISAFLLGIFFLYSYLKNHVKKVIKEKNVIYKGAVGEKKVKDVLDSVKNDNDFVINDYLVDDNRGSSHQIDHIFISKNGIYVIETKNYAGRIYGREKEQEWTEVLAYGNVKNRFYNPLKQNETHAAVIRSITKNKFKIITCLVFVDGDISNIDASCVFDLDTLEEMLRETSENQALTIEEEKEAYDLLIAKQASTTTTIDEHVENIKQKQNDIKNGICPRCGGNLVLRHGKYGDFYSCSNYPKCTFKTKK